MQISLVSVLQNTFCVDSIQSKMVNVDVKSVYSMGTAELRRAFRKASRDRIAKSKYWDALMYRSSVLRSEFSMSDVSAILDSLVRYPKFSSPMFVEYMIDPVPTKGASVMDAALILRSIRHLITDERLLSQTDKRLQDVMSEKLSNKISVPDVDKLARVLARSSELNSILSQRMRSIISNIGIEKLKNCSTVLSVLKFLVFEKKYQLLQIPEDEPFFDSVSETSRDTELLKNVFAQTLTVASKFNAKDVIDFSLCLAELVKRNQLVELGHPSTGPILSLLNRAIRRNQKSFKPDELVLLITIDLDLDRNLLSGECRYRVREFKPSSCVRILEKRDDLQSDLRDALIARLHKFDACKELTVENLISIASRLDRDAPLSKSFLENMVSVTRKADRGQMRTLTEIFKTHGLEISSS